MKIDLKRFGKFLGREVAPILEPVAKITLINKLMKYPLEVEAAELARKNKWPEAEAIAYAQAIRLKLVEVVNNL